MQPQEPIFSTIAKTITDEILRGRYQPGQQVASTNELAVFYRVNPATAGKALSTLANSGILEKRRGLGMFVTTAAVAIIQKERSDSFKTRFINPLITEAEILGIATDELVEMIKKSTESKPADKGENHD